MSDTTETRADAAAATASDDATTAAEAAELAAAERLSSAPVDDDVAARGGAGSSGSGGGDAFRVVDGGSGPVGIGFFGWVRWMWRQLTSMRTALILLFLLSLAAVPGSLVPQDSNPDRVDTFRQSHHTLAPIYDKLGLFHVYSSFWFSAIYILLFVSLAGCIIPRSWQFVGVLRSQPPAAPRNLVRLPVYATWRSRTNERVALSAAEQLLRKRHFRVARNGDSLTSEKGYLREVGNLLFHISLFGLLIAFAVSKLFGGMGTVIVIEGHTFSNSVSQYDDFSPSTFFKAGSLDPFGFKLDGFKATYQTSGDQLGTARTYQAKVSYWTGTDEKHLKNGVIEENHPLEVDGSNVYLTAHGYAPVVEVKNAQGQVIFDGPTPCLPQDMNMTSTCAIKVNDGYTDSKGVSEQIGLSGLFTPTAAPTSEFTDGRGPHSIFPDTLQPELYLTPFYGDLGDNSGAPQSVYQIDTTHMKQYTVASKQKDGTTKQVPLAVSLAPGQAFNLPSGGSVTLVDVQQWANFTIAHNPATGWALGSGLAAVIGLIGSLFIQRRRIWVRAVTGADGFTRIELAGLARSESARIAEELAAIALDLQRAARAEREPAADAAPAAADAKAKAEPATAADAEPAADAKPAAEAKADAVPAARTSAADDADDADNADDADSADDADDRSAAAADLTPKE